MPRLTSRTRFVLSALASRFGGIASADDIALDASEGRMRANAGAPESKAAVMSILMGTDRAGLTFRSCGVYHITAAGRAALAAA